VEFRDVTFRYKGAAEPALRNVSFTANPGSITAIIGGTGSGKTTLAAAIARFYDVEGGAVLLGGVDVRRMPQRELREKVCYVSQQPTVFSGTVLSNLRYGKESAELEHVTNAAKAAQAHGFIESREGGYESPIAPGGVNVSGGQRQRLSIARSLVRDPLVYVFDDCLSALDYITEAKLRKELESVAKDHTVIVVAQRVSSIRHADQILVLDGGHIVGVGKHDELLKNCPVYNEIVLSQEEINEEAS